MPWIVNLQISLLGCCNFKYLRQVAYEARCWSSSEALPEIPLGSVIPCYWFCNVRMIQGIESKPHFKKYKAQGKYLVTSWNLQIWNLRCFPVEVIQVHIKTTFFLVEYGTREGLDRQPATSLRSPTHSCSSAQSIWKTTCDEPVTWTSACFKPNCTSTAEFYSRVTLTLVSHSNCWNETRSESCDSEWCFFVLFYPLLPCLLLGTGDGIEGI